VHLHSCAASSSVGIDGFGSAGLFVIAQLFRLRLILFFQVLNVVTLLFEFNLFGSEPLLQRVNFLLAFGAFLDGLLNG